MKKMKEIVEALKGLKENHALVLVDESEFVPGNCNDGGSYRFSALLKPTGVADLVFLRFATSSEFSFCTLTGSFEDCPCHRVEDFQIPVIRDWDIEDVLEDILEDIELRGYSHVALDDGAGYIPPRQGECWAVQPIETALKSVMWPHGPIKEITSMEVIDYDE